MDKKMDKSKSRNNAGRNPGDSICTHPCFQRQLQSSEWLNEHHDRSNNKHHNKCLFRRLLEGQSGYYLLGLLIFLPIMLALSYAPVDQWVLMVKQQKAEHVMHKYLARMQTEGYLSTADEAQLITDYAVFSCTVNPATDIAGPRESQGASRVLRPNPISLQIQARPTPQPLQSNKLLGLNQPDSTFRIKVGGTMRSERVRP